MVQERIIKKIFRLYPLIIFLTVIIFIIVHFLYSSFTPVFIGEKKEIYIMPGIKTWLLAQKLEKEGIIKSAFYFRLFTSLKKSKIKAGIYEFNGYYNLLNIIEILEKGGRGIKITLSEGLTLKEIENILAKNNFKVNLSQYKIKDFPELKIHEYFPPEASLEGFLAPDTYEFFPSDDEKKIIIKILSNFMSKFFPELLKGNEFNLYERLILASIIEKEAKHSEDFAVISGILIKRLKNNWRLEVDAPLIYEKCGFIYCNEKLTKQDLQKESPFNTYKISGLIKQPISNPGITAIKSVINPLETPYWFYLTDSEGRAIFSKNFQEHQQNIKKYLK